MAPTYLLDTNICIYFTKGSKPVLEKFESVGLRGCRISEVKVAELLYGAENSVNRERNLAMFKMALRDMEVLPISPCLPASASEKPDSASSVSPSQISTSSSAPPPSITALHW